ncbi:HAD family phosphatase [Cohnella pontilimi]|uniref:HAD family phosphatase n=1 Tax=Cohnella pontilimi TaxID=2564100 RepID=A0A4U0F5V4_9BACL|nr:Cof-type HAD-IIB family hydrolase [Cohnella pontilimi]TJY39810.1 HAD family phosphatase [Cohnella pontilimi]
MSQYRLLALDLDGTLLNDRQEISEMNAEWVRRAREAGIAVCISTGRGFPSAVPFAEQLRLDGPLITVNGGEIWRSPHELYRRTLLPADMIIRLHDLALRQDVWFWAYTTERIYNKDGWIEEDAERSSWLKFGYYTEDHGVLEQILGEIREWGGLEITNSSPFNIEINPAGVSKAAAIEEVCRMIGCDISEAVAVGDSLNDIAAIRACGLGVAMGNAQEEVKTAADVVTGTNLEDGVAHMIRQYVLKA